MGSKLPDPTKSTLWVPGGGMCSGAWIDGDLAGDTLGHKAEMFEGHAVFGRAGERPRNALISYKHSSLKIMVIIKENSTHCKNKKGIKYEIRNT